MPQLLPATFGRTDSVSSIPGVRVTDAWYQPGLAVPPHEHQYPSWTAVVSGAFEERFERHSLLASTGTLLIKPSTARHSNRYGPGGARALVIEFTDAGTLGQFAAELLDSVGLVPAHVAAAHVQRVQREIVRRETGWQLALHSALLELALETVRTRPRTPRRRPGWLARVAERLSSEFASAPSLSDLAREAGVHPVYLCAAFRARYACTPGEFLRRSRLEHARRQLSETTDSVSAVALAAGFSDQSHFTRQFRASFGTTPAAYRRGLRR